MKPFSMLATRALSSAVAQLHLVRSVRTSLFVLIFINIQNVLVAASQEEKPMMLDDALRQHLLLVAVAPDYPREYEWRPAHGNSFGSGPPSGGGVFDLRFDYETGHLREVHVLESTGSRKLDAHTIGALKLWKAKPRSIHTLRVPIT